MTTFEAMKKRVCDELAPPSPGRTCKCLAVVGGAAIMLCSAQAQRAVDVPKTAEKDRAERQVKKQQEKVAQNSNVEIAGANSFKEQELLSQLKEQIASISELGLTTARADDAAFFLELFYRKHGFAKVNVRYVMPGGKQLRLEIDEGERVTIGNIHFVGNDNIASDKLFDFVIGPTRERYSKAEKKLPYVQSDLDEGVDLVRRYYISEGFLNVIVQAPHIRPARDNLVDVTIAIVEGRRFHFGDISFAGRTVFEPEKLRAEMADILKEPYTDRRLADIPRRLQAFYKERGYFEVKVDALGAPDAAHGSLVPVRVTISPGVVYSFDGVSVTGLQRLHPSFLPKRFKSLRGKQYNPKVLDEKFREMMKTGLFNILQIKPIPVDGNMLQLQIAVEEAKAKQFGFSLGYGTYAGLIVGASYQDRNFLGTGRPVTTLAEYSSRGYKGEIIYEDPWLFDSDYHFKLRLSALTFDFEGYSKFEFGERVDLSRNITKKYEVGAVLMARHVEVTSASIPEPFLGRTSYQVNSIGATQRLDLRENPLAAPRGLAFDSSIDYASKALGGDLEFVRTTAHVSYYIPFAPKKQAVQLNPTTADEKVSGLQRWFRQSMIAFGARVGLIQGLSGTEIPIDERFFNGGANSVRSFGERDLGPHVGGDPIGGEFFSVYNVEYTFPIFGELQGAVFVDAGNLLPDAGDAGFDDMRYAVGLGLRYKLPIGPLRLDYGVNPSPRDYEDFGAFHFSFGFAF